MEDLHRQALEILLGAVTGLDNRCASIVAAHNQNDTSLSPRQRAKVLQAVRAFQLSYLAYDSDDDEDQGDDDEGDGDEDGDLGGDDGEGDVDSTTQYGMPVRPDPCDLDRVTNRTDYRNIAPWHLGDEPIYSADYLREHGFEGYVNPPPLETSYIAQCDCRDIGAGGACCATRFGSCGEFLQHEQAMAMDARSTGGGCMDPRCHLDYETVVRHLLASSVPLAHAQYLVLTSALTTPHAHRTKTSVSDAMSRAQSS
jgi:hypothetical protein